MKIGNLEVYGIIYKITNIVNGKVYIGQTVNKNGFNGRYDRKGDGIERVYKKHDNLEKLGCGYNKHLFDSIKKHGIYNFKVDEIFDVAFSKEELNIKEKCWILYYDSYKNGYNNNLGGDGNSGYEGLKGENNPMAKPIVQLSLKGDFIKEWNCMEYAVNELHVSKSDISNICNQKSDKNGYYRKSAGGFLWMFLEDYNNGKEITYNNKAGEYNKKPVVKLSLNGIFIKQYNSISSACRDNNGSMTSKIANCCQGKRKSHNRYLWVYKEDYNKNKLYALNTSNYGEKISIICLTTGECFESIADASLKFFNKKDSHISSCCSGKRNYCGKLPNGTKLKWMYYEDYIKQKQQLIHNEILGQAV